MCSTIGSYIYNIHNIIVYYIIMEVFKLNDNRFTGKTRCPWGKAGKNGGYSIIWRKGLRKRPFGWKRRGCVRSHIPSGNQEWWINFKPIKWIEQIDWGRIRIIT